jgi:signal transduction histidine kinase
VRLRLTVLYGGLFLFSGAGLLALTYLLVRQSTGSFFYLSKGPGPQEVSVRGVVGGASVKAGGLAGVAVTRRVQGGPALAPLPVTPQQLRAQAHQLTVLATQQHGAELHQLLVKSGIALAIMAVVSVALGWLISGRVLRPLEAAFEAQRRFVANASHELRTPLAMMRTSLDVAVAKPEPAPPQLGVLEHKLREGLDQADRLLESFLVLARAQHGALPEHATVSLARIASAAVEAHRAAIDRRSIEVRRQMGEAWVTGSEMLLARMVDNVVENAVRHNEERGWIHVETGIRGAVALVAIESGGPLLDEDAVARLAQPFRRLGAERTGSQDGVGLGLSIVAAIASAHGGALELHALPRGGLRVQIELPRAPRPDGADRADAGPVDVRPAAEGASSAGALT